MKSILIIRNDDGLYTISELTNEGKNYSNQDEDGTTKYQDDGNVARD